MASYQTMEAARQQRKKYLRELRLITNIRECETCDKYHLKADEKKLRIPASCKRALELLGLGYTSTEAAKIMGLSKQSIEKYYYRLRFTFGALSGAHLVAIAISLGVVNPNEFVAPIVERNHA